MTLTKQDIQDILDIINQVGIRGSQAERITEIKAKLKQISSEL